MENLYRISYNEESCITSYTNTAGLSKLSNLFMVVSGKNTTLRAMLFDSFYSLSIPGYCYELNRVTTSVNTLSSIIYYRHDVYISFFTENLTR